MAQLKEPIRTYYPFQRMHTTSFLLFAVSRERNATIIIVTCGPHPLGQCNPLKYIPHAHTHTRARI